MKPVLLVTFLSILLILSFIAPTISISIGNETFKTITLYPTADSYVDSDSRTVNYGGDTSLEVYYSHYLFLGFSRKYTYLKFDLSRIPSDAVIVSAYLELYCKYKSAATVVVGVHYVEEDWNEVEITYSNRPLFRPQPSDTVSVAYGDHWYSWEVTNEIKTNLEKRRVSFALSVENTDTYLYVVFYSKEGWKNHPHLVIMYRPPKQPSTISCSISTTTVGYNETLYVEGSIKPKRVNKTVILTYTRPNASRIVHCVKTDLGGNYYDSLQPDVIGAWTVKASWGGDDEYYGSTSSIIPFTVTKASSKISLTLHPEKPVYGKSIWISGILNPPLENEKITLRYIKPNGEILVKNVKTSLNGAFTDTQLTDIAGSWYVEATWTGNEFYHFSQLGLSFLVKKAPVSIVLYVPEYVNKGEPIKISGKTNPPLTSITLRYCMDSITLRTKNVLVYPNGTFTDTFTPTKAGKWRVIASWKGNVNYEKATNSTTFEVRGCLIATSTYGSALSPQVQFLRNFRDNIVQKTYAGSQFLDIFYRWYYSFSPTIADYIYENENLKTVMRIILQPLLSILYLSTIIYSTLSFNSELAIVFAGFIASSLIGIFYFLPFVAVLMIPLVKIFKFRLTTKFLKLVLNVWIVSLGLILLGELIVSNILMKIATGMFVVLTIALVVGLLVKLFCKIQTVNE